MSTVAPSTPPGTVTVTRVVDGDTIDIEVAGQTERVRLIGIDTPEAVRPDAPVECYGPEASAFLGEYLPSGTQVSLARDVVGRDDYGRLLAYVWRASDGTFVNEAIVRSGYARPLTIEPNDTYAETFVDAAREAEENGRGLWSACAG